MPTSVFAQGPHRVQGPSGSLEVVVDVPQGVPPQPIIAIIAHPLPTQGGTMQNKVVTTLAQTLCHLGIPCVRFNFRGVGASDGVFDDGVGEQADLLAVVAWARVHAPQSAVWLAGFSFGAYVVLAASPKIRPEVVITVAPPVGRWNFSAIIPPARWIVIQGEEDEVIDPQAVYAWIASTKATPQVIAMPDTSHFFHRKLVLLRQELCAALHTDFMHKEAESGPQL